MTDANIDADVMTPAEDYMSAMNGKTLCSNTLKK
jgi:hypothetical protein